MDSTQQPLQTHAAVDTETRQALIILGVLLALWAALFWPTLVSTADIWMRSETFAHGAIIPLISAWLIWRKRHALWQQPVKPFVLAGLPLAGLVLLWLLALAADVLVVQQLAVFMLLPTLVILVMGLRFSAAITFPLAYLMFAVPFGEELTLPMQNITADITVAALQLTGIPVYINGLFIEIPTGKFEVAEACSGIRYLIASLALGTLYAYLSYSSFKKRLIFMAASLIVPIIANGLRAYGIVMIAHLSDMKYATGVDHLIYGWFFFGIIIGLMFWVGSYWQDPASDFDTPAKTTSARHAFNIKKAVPVASFAALVFVIGYIGAYQIKQVPTGYKIDPIELELTGWHAVDSDSDWQPHYVGADTELQQFYRAVPTASTTTSETAKKPVGFYLANYQFESQNKELISAQNLLFQGKRWTVAGKSTKTIKVHNQDVQIKQLEIRALDGAKRRIWSWYKVMGQAHTSNIEIKARQAVGKLIGLSQSASVFALMAEYDDSAEAEARLSAFISDNWQALMADDLINLTTEHTLLSSTTE